MIHSKDHNRPVDASSFLPALIDKGCHLCVCVCERERERERGPEKESEPRLAKVTRLSSSQLCIIMLQMCFAHLRADIIDNHLHLY